MRKVFLCSYFFLLSSLGLCFYRFNRFLSFYFLYFLFCSLSYSLVQPKEKIHQQTQTASKEQEIAKAPTVAFTSKRQALTASQCSSELDQMINNMQNIAPKDTAPTKGTFFHSFFLFFVSFIITTIEPDSIIIII